MKCHPTRSFGTHVLLVSLLWSICIGPRAVLSVAPVKSHSYNAFRMAKSIFRLFLCQVDVAKDREINLLGWQNLIVDKVGMPWCVFFFFQVQNSMLILLNAHKILYIVMGLG